MNKNFKINAENYFTKGRNVKGNYDCTNISTMKTFCRAKYFCEPKTIHSLIRTIKKCRKLNLKYFVVGAGSNFVFLSNFFDGLLISTKNISKIKMKKDFAKCCCGAFWGTAIKKAMNRSLGGLEFLMGVPTSIGGAVFGNAGAFGKDMSCVVKKVKVFNGKKTFIIKNSKEIFEYRNSVFKQKGYVVLKVWLKLKRQSATITKQKLAKIIKKKMQTQPMGKHSCGCIFKNPKDDYAARLIDVCGGKEMSFGNASVSKKHANFIVNNGNASGKEIFILAKQVQKLVYDKTNIMLEFEVQFV